MCPTLRMNRGTLSESVRLEMKVEIMCCWCLSCCSDCLSLGAGSSFNSTVITHKRSQHVLLILQPRLVKCPAFLSLCSLLSALCLSSMKYTDQYQHVSVSDGSSHREFSPAVPHHSYTVTILQMAPTPPSLKIPKYINMQIFVISRCFMTQDDSFTVKSVLSVCAVSTS